MSRVSRVLWLTPPSDASFISDYIANQRLDVYDTGDLNDDEEFSDPEDARMRAEVSMKTRDRRAGRGAGEAAARRKGRMAQFLTSDDDGDDSENEERLLGQQRFRRDYDEPMGEDEAGVSFFSLWPAVGGLASGADAAPLPGRRKCPSSSSPTSRPTRLPSGLSSRGRAGPSCASSATSSSRTPMPTATPSTVPESASSEKVCADFPIASSMN